MFHKDKLYDVNCNRRNLFICKMSSKPNGFKNEMKLSDHLYNIEKDIIDIKLNLTLVSDKLKETKTSTQTPE